MSWLVDNRALICTISGLMNIAGISLFNLGFTRWKALSDADPDLFSLHGQISIILWGFLFFAIAKSTNKNVFLVLTIEKAYYGLRWVLWHQAHSFVKYDFLTRAFLVIYGLNDITFCILNLGIALALHYSKTTKASKIQ